MHMATPTYMKPDPRYLVLAAVGLLAIVVVRRTRNRTGKPGRRKSLKTRSLEAGASFLQRLTPARQFNLYLDGFHFESGHLGRQIRACHYCTVLNEDLIQCAIFDGNGAAARLIGIEYVVSERVFQSLPEEEKVLWHSHAYEVRSGQLSAPGLPAWAELELMQKIQNTYGKMWHTWDIAHDDALPLGIPRLMMGFTEDGQLKPELLAERDRLLNLATERTRAQRVGLTDS
ncbi:MAG: OBAP family protein, partial [Limisphaerales bacterium]